MELRKAIAGQSLKPVVTSDKPLLVYKDAEDDDEDMPIDKVVDNDEEDDELLHSKD